MKKSFQLTKQVSRNLNRQPINDRPKTSIRDLRVLLANHLQCQKPSEEGAVPETLAGRPMRDSFDRFVLPLGSDPDVREQYLSSRASVRFGVILEDLDTFAVWLSYRHNQGLSCLGPNTASQPMAIVTACVDRIDLHGTEPIKNDSDIVLEGHVSWTGRSSIEAYMCLRQEVSSGQWEPILDAKFVMVALDPFTRKSTFVHPVIAENDEEKQIFKLGAEASLRRKQQLADSLLKVPPSPEEVDLVHSLFLSTVHADAHTFKHRILPDKYVWSDECSLKNMFICFPQQRNLYGKIFGGFLMRSALELAWANACVFSRTRPVIVAVDDIMFKKPVEVGSLLYLSSQVCYCKGPYMQVRVHAEVVNPEEGTQETTNTFHFTFRTGSGSDANGVMPKTYADMMLYLSGKRHFDEAMMFRDS